MSDDTHVTVITVGADPEDYRHPAIRDTCGKILLVKNNKPCEGVQAYGSSGGEISVILSEELFRELILPLVLKHEPDRLNGADEATYVREYRKYVVFRFSCYSGMFLSCNFEVGQLHNDVDELFNDFRIVNDFYFRYGMVPKTFKDVEGYRSATKDLDDASGEETRKAGDTQ